MRALGLLLPAFILTTPISAFADEPEWELVSEDDGIKVWQQEVPDSSQVRFRGRSKLKVGLKQILAVLQDWKRKTEWMQNCVENKPLRFLGVGQRVVYNRTASGFPLISDRDVVVRSNLRILDNKRGLEIMVADVKDDMGPEVDGVVRMADLSLRWKLLVISPTETDVTYEVQADPGGSLPMWLVNLASKKIPHNTIANLRKQVKKDYSAELAYVENAYDWKSVGL